MLRLNSCDIEKTAEYGSHDPSMMYDPVTRRYYSYCTDVWLPESRIFNRQGIPVRVSDDLVTFRCAGVALSPEAVKEGADNGEYPPTRGFWAPFVEYVNGEYRMYYSATKAFGSWESRIWLAVSDKPEGPFENRAVVMDSWHTTSDSPNAIDPHIIWAQEKPYLIYGSFFGGIYCKPLDAATGTAVDGARDRGICIARKPKGAKLDGPEGAAVIFVPETGYFYLFLSYGWLGDTYDIRVGRSRTVTGPYLDFDGKDLCGGTHGTKLAGSYCFSRSLTDKAGGESEEWAWAGLRGPGHGVPFFDVPNNRYFFVHHIRDGASMYRSYDAQEDRDSYRVHYMMIRRMYFDENGWPLFSPEPWNGAEQEISRTETNVSETKTAVSAVTPEPSQTEWEIVHFRGDFNGMCHAQKMTLAPDDLYLKKGKLLKGYDFENEKEAVLLTGMDEAGNAFWGKCL